MSKLPTCVVVYLTDYCKLKCKHCFLSQNNCINKNMIDFGIIKKLLLTFKENNVFMVAFTGGDPMLHPQIFEILSLTKKMNMLPLLGISGNNITDNFGELIFKNGVRCVQIGLNGSNEILNDSYRGKGNFLEVINAVNILKRNNVNVNLAFCLDKNNVSDLENMLILAKKLNIYKVKIEFWNCTKPSIYNKNNELNFNEKENVRIICDSYMDKNNKFGWIQYPKSSSALSNIHKNSLVVMANGDVKNNEMGKTLGNIYKNDILNIMEGK